MQVIKRNGNCVPFDIQKVSNAIKKAFKSVNQPIDDSVIDLISLRVSSDFASKIVDDKIKVEDIQDSVEKVLGETGYGEVSKSYILYRKTRDKARNLKSTVLDYKKLVDSYLKLNDWRVKENSTVTYSLGGLILSNSGAITANYWLNEVYDEEIANAHKNCDFHIHDLSMLSGYCAGWSLKQLIQEGLGGVTGKITSKPAKHLSTLCNQMVNFIGIMQNEWAGAQAFSSFDTYLAPFVKADNLSYNEVKQAISSFIFGVNTPSRWGCVPMTTEVLTPEGWKKYDELHEGDSIYTWKYGKLNVNKINHLIKHKNESGKLHVFKNDHYRYSQTVNPEHRVLTERTGLVNADVVAERYSDFSVPIQFYGSLIESSCEQLMNAEVEIAARLYCDGCFDTRGPNSTIHKITYLKSSKRENPDYISKLFDSYGLQYTHGTGSSDFSDSMHYWTFYGDSARKLYKLTGGKRSIDKKFTNLSMEQSELFLRVWTASDGEKGKFRLQCDNDDIVRAIQHIAVRAGYTSSVTHPHYGSGFIGNNVKIRRVRGARIYQYETLNYDGYVWCPNTDDGIVIFRENENVFISGNCQAPFSNITLDWVCPEDLKNLPVIIGGEEQDFTYGDCQKEIDMVNKAFIEIMIEGDANGRGFQYPIPTYSITKDFDWSEDKENNKLLFEMTAKYGTPYFSNYINSDMSASDVRSMCCRLRLDLRELRKKSGGYFGSGESTGSIGVVTLNLPRLAYLSKDEEDFYKRLDHLMDVAARSLKVKRDEVTKLLEAGLYPYTKRYLGTFNNHFSTIGLVGMNECCLNAKWLGENISHEKEHQFAIDVLNHMRERLSDYQEMYGDLYNLESTPAESTSYRFALHDRQQFPDIITASSDDSAPYYTNSTNLPVGYTYDIFEALDHQDPLQTLYTSGTVFHAFLGEKMPNWKSAMNLVKKIAENYKLPYYTISPTYSVCTEHGYIAGEVYKCPHCGKPTEVYSRITGYYRPVQNWNIGKSEEFKERKTYDVPNSKLTHHGPIEEGKDTQTKEENGEVRLGEGVYLFTTKTCPNCKVIKKYLDSNNITYETVDAEDRADLSTSYNIMKAPTLVSVDSKGVATIVSGVGDIRNYFESRK